MTRAGWTAVATSAAIGPRGRLRVHVGGAERVLWRDAGGGLRLFDNRCPHRGMRLSFGFVRGEALVCLYHGWRFGADGGCRRIPAHPDLEPPASIRVAAFPVVEAAGLVFAAEAAPLATPALPPGDFRPCRSIHVPGSAEALAAALLAGPPPGVAARAAGEDLVLLDGAEADGRPWRALVAVAPAEPGSAAAHAAVDGSEGAVLGLARWLVARRDGLLGEAA